MMMRPPETAALRVEGISKSFGAGRRQLWAVRDASFHVSQGECVALVGESGSGKTTLARLIVGLATPNAGKVLFAGEDVASLSIKRASRRNLAARVQMVFQDPYSSLDPRMRIGDIIGEPLQILGWSRSQRKERIGEVMSLVGLPADFAERRPSELSGGQRQRVGIARALGPRPQLLLLDEPVASLDVSIQGQILSLLKEIQQKTAISMLVIAHDLGVVRAIADRTLVMYLGSVVEAGRTDEVFEHPHHPYTLALLQSASTEGRKSMSPVAKAALASEPLPFDERHIGCAFRSRCWRAIPACAHAVQRVSSEGGHWADCNVPYEGVSDLEVRS